MVKIEAQYNAFCDRCTGQAAVRFRKCNEQIPLAEMSRTQEIHTKGPAEFGTVKYTIVHVWHGMAQQSLAQCSMVYKLESIYIYIISCK